MREKLLKLLGNGHSVAIAATAVGCDVSYVSQLLAQEDFALEVAKLRCAGIEESVARDSKYDDLEDLLLEKLETVLPFMLKPRDILDALTRINAAKRRGTPAVSADNLAQTTIIPLQLPQIIVQNFTINGQGEVVDVENRALTNMPAATLMKSLEDRSAKRASETIENSKQNIPILSSKQVERSVFTEDSV